MLNGREKMPGFYTKNGEAMSFGEVMSRISIWARSISLDSPSAERDFVVGEQIAAELLESLGGSYAVACIRRVMHDSLDRAACMRIVAGTLRDDLSYDEKACLVERHLMDVITRMRLES